MGILLAIIGLALGGLLKGATGAGAPIIAVPVMAIYFGVPLAVTVFAIPNLLANIWQGWIYRKHRLPYGFILPFAGGGALGAALGTLLLVRLPGSVLTMSVAVAVFAYIGFRMIHPGWVLRYRLAERIAFPVSTLAGILQGAVGISAPVSITFLNAMRLERPQFIATISIFFTMMGVVQVPLLVVYGYMDWLRFAISTAALLPILAMMPLGAWLSRRISSDVFDKIILFLLAGIALRLMFQAV